MSAQLNRIPRGWWLPVLVLSVILITELILIALWNSSLFDERASTTQASDLVVQAADFGLPPITKYAAIVDRPLFESDRRPVRPVGAIVHKRAETPSQLNKYTLTAIIITAGQRLAMFKDNRTRSMLRLNEGDELESWEVEAISEDSVTLRFNDRTMEIILRRQPNKGVGGTSQKAPQKKVVNVRRRPDTARVLQRPRRNLEAQFTEGTSSGPEPVETRRPDRPKREIQ